MTKTEIHKVQIHSDGCRLLAGRRIAVLADLLRFVVRCLMLVVLVCWSLRVSAQTTYFRTESGIPFVPFLSSAPSSPVTGATYTNSTDGLTYWYNGSVWIPLSGSPGLITSPSGRVWMDRNVGAYRAATSSIDYLAYGSLFQWCRGADGHQLIVWTSSTAGTPVNGTTTTLSGSITPGHSLFIISNSPYDWLSTQLSDGSAWWNGSVAGINNPCPGGFHVPTAAEWNAELTAGMTSDATAYSILKLTKAGYRYGSTGALSYTGTQATYQSSTIGGTGIYILLFANNGSTSVPWNIRVAGFSVRCIKD